MEKEKLYKIRLLQVSKRELINPSNRFACPIAEQEHLSI